MPTYFAGAGAQMRPVLSMTWRTGSFARSPIS
jgi:hypothetical protein